ncbi:hypothetical protein TorRG33x02_052810, partial [Trema orientale]
RLFTLKKSTEKKKNEEEKENEGHICHLVTPEPTITLDRFLPPIENSSISPKRNRLAAGGRTLYVQFVVKRKHDPFLSNENFNQKPLVRPIIFALDKNAYICFRTI